MIWAKTVFKHIVWLVVMFEFGKNFGRRHFGIFFLDFPENRLRNFKQIVSFRETKGDRQFTAKSMAYFLQKKIMNLSSTEFAQRVLHIIPVSR